MPWLLEAVGVGVGLECYYARFEGEIGGFVGDSLDLRNPIAANVWRWHGLCTMAINY